MTDIRKRLETLSPKRKRALLVKLLHEKKAGKPKIYPLSYAQQRLWFLDQMTPGSAFYNVDTAVRLDFPIDVGCLERAINEIVRRHEALRTTFKPVNGKPVQMVAPQLDIALELIDLTSQPEEEREKEAMRIATEEAKRAFDLSRGPLLRTRLIRLGGHNHVFLLTMHHIVSDGWSLNVFSQELADLYDAFSSGRPSPLPDLRTQYPDFALWQRKWLRGGPLESQLSYWKEKLADLPVLQLPTDRPRPAVPSLAGAFHYFRLSKQLVEALRSLGKQNNATLFMTLLAAFKVLMRRYMGRSDIVVGTPVANRNRSEIEGLIGFFVNMLVLRTDLDGDPTFRDVVRRVRETALEAYTNQDVPFEKLVDELQPDRDLSKNPLFQVSFQVFKDPGPAGALENEKGMLDVQRGTANIDFGFDACETADGVTGRIEYSTDLFESATIARMMIHFEVLLAAIVDDPDTRISDLPLLTASERQQILGAWNETSTVLRRGTCVHHLFERAANRTPDAIALVDERRVLTYRQLDAFAERVARRLRGMDIGPGALVALWLDRSAEFVAGLLGVLKAGAAYVPIDPEYPTERVNVVVEDAMVSAILTHGSRADDQPAGVARILCLDELLAAQGPNGTETQPVCALDDELRAYVIYTSGSTGAPKGVQVTHRNLVNQLTWMQTEYPLLPEDRMLHKYSISFDVATLEILSPLIAGARLVIARSKGQLDMPYFGQLIREQGITAIDVVPSQLRMLLDAGVLDGCHTLRRIVCGGETLSQELARDVFEHCDAELSNLYGPTETSITATFHRCSRDGGSTSVPIGRPIANTRVYVLDEFSNPVPIGVSGELHIGGECVTKGYLNNPSLTSDRFVPNPVRPEEGRVYKSGDLVRWLPDGNLEFLRRIDHQVKIRGYRIELGEIETCLKDHPGIVDAVVTEVVRPPAEPTGSDRADADASVEVERQLVGYVVPSRGDGGQPVPGTASDGDQLSRWRIEYEEIYGREVQLNDPTFNAIGWDSGFNGMPLPEAEMREQVTGSANRVLALNPDSVLEIGCGTGLLLFEIAPHCRRYCATDFAEAGLRSIQNALQHRELQHVTTELRPAEDFSDIESESFDVVLLNSVIQYFPSADYLLKVIQRACRVLRPGGYIFLGDVRSLPLLEAFHTAVEVVRAPAGQASTLLRDNVRKRLQREEELVIDPRFFSELGRTVPGLREVQVQLKRGRLDNELTRFRYDVVLRIGGDTQDRCSPRTVPWRDVASMDDLRQLVKDAGQQPLRINDIPNARLVADTRALELLGDPTAPPTVGDLRELLQRSETGAVHPEDLRDLGRDLGSDVCVSWSESGHPAHTDAVFQPMHNGAHGLVGSVRIKVGKRRSLLRYTTHPLQGKTAEKLVPLLPEFLRECLPEYMIPSAFVVLDTLPVNAVGKVDRDALPTPQELRPRSMAVLNAPRSRLEIEIAGAWKDVLELEAVGVDDNFFDIGGHSLLIVRLHSRVRESLGNDLSIIDLFQHPTIASLAQHLEGRNGNTGRLTSVHARAERQLSAINKRKHAIRKTKTDT